MPTSQLRVDPLKLDFGEQGALAAFRWTLPLENVSRRTIEGLRERAGVRANRSAPCATPPASAPRQLLALLALAADPTPATPTVTRDEIFAAWRARQGQIRSFHVEWEGEAFFAAGSMFWSPTAVHAAQGKKLPPVPAEDTTFTTHFSLDVDVVHGRVRFAGHRPMWHTETGYFLEHDFLNVSRDGLWFQYLGEEQGGSPLGRRGTIQKHPEAPDSTSADVWPLFLSAAPLHPVLRPLHALDKWRVSDELASGGGRPGFVLELGEPRFASAASGGQLERLFVDSTIGGAIVRYVKQHGERTTQEIEIAYSDGDTTNPAMPKGWIARVYSMINEPRLLRQERAVVSRIVLNETIPPERFELAYPVGAWVDDHTSGRQWIVRAGGGQRLITRDELTRGASHAELIATESGQAGLRPRNWGPALVGWGFVGVISAASAFRYASRRRRRAQSAGPAPAISSSSETECA
jgi:hypothetical protein